MLFEHAQADRRSLLLAGGGLRQMYAAAALARKYTVYAAGLDAMPEHVLPADALTGQADALVLPMPVTRDGVHLNVPPEAETVSLPDLLKRVKPDGIVTGGRMTDAERETAERAGFAVRDYARDEAFILRNAVPTAEGAIAIAMQNLPVTLHGTKCLILGGGRVSAALQTRLSALHADVTVSARSAKDRARAASIGLKTVPLSALSGVIADYTLIINTIPAMILSAALLAEIRPDALTIDLASKPGGDGVGAKTDVKSTMKKNGIFISAAAAIGLLTAVFLAEGISRPRDLLTVSVQSADGRNLPALTELTAASRMTVQSSTVTGTTAAAVMIRNLNLADAPALMRANGIGETLANEIIAYRAAHGGFTRRAQLMEIRGIGAELAERIMAEFEIPDELPAETSAPPVITEAADTEAVTTAAQTEKAPPVLKDVNTISRAELLEIPDMTEECADRILEFRDHTERIVSLYELSVLDGFETEWIRRTLVPYLYVEGDIYAQDMRDSAAG